MPDINNDRIVYTVITEPGGVDGLDRNDPGGKMVAAFYSKMDAQNKKGVDTRLKIVPIVVDAKEAERAARRKLNPLDLLVLGLHK